MGRPPPSVQALAGLLLGFLAADGGVAGLVPVALALVASLLLASLPTWAIDPPKDAPVEKADPIVVVGFLVLFIGACLGYVGWLMYTQKGKKEE